MSVYFFMYQIIAYYLSIVQTASPDKPIYAFFIVYTILL